MRYIKPIFITIIRGWTQRSATAAAAGDANRSGNKVCNKTKYLDAIASVGLPMSVRPCFDL